MARTPLLKVSEKDVVWDAHSMKWGQARGNLVKGKRNHHRKFPSGIMPTMIRSVVQNAWGDVTVVLERPPCYETITYYGVQKADAKQEWAEEQSYTIPLPWTLYVGNFDGEEGLMHSLNLFALPMSLDNIYAVEDSMLYLLPLSNYYADGSFCLPSEAMATPVNTLEEAAELMYTSVWNSEFNLDVTDATRLYYRDYEVREYSAFVPNNSYDKRRTSQAALFHEWSKKSLNDITGTDAYALWVQSDMPAMEIFSYEPVAQVTQFIDLVMHKVQK